MYAGVYSGMSNRQERQVDLADEQATVEFGRSLAAQLVEQYEGRGLVFLRGQLGAGKTTLVRGLLTALGHQGAVKSPTYTLLEPYSYNGQDAFHFDLYRISDAEELAFVGFDEIIDGPGIKLIEWPEKAQSWLPSPDVDIHIEVVSLSQSQQLGRRAHVRFL